ncbi:uncharacterized protein LOC143521872 [Brachyhypopomus gauderio]|uniref:uncharacterized protein LOC143521872 n=1 Tax=Brachyhypopomus gauderio TaxID=698409 RepID=UPI0040434A4E
MYNQINESTKTTSVMSANVSKTTLTDMNTKTEIQKTTFSNSLGGSNHETLESTADNNATSMPSSNPRISTNLVSNGTGNSEVTTVTSPFVSISQANSLSSDSSTMKPSITGSQTKSLMSLSESTSTAYPQISTPESKGSANGVATESPASNHTSATRQAATLTPTESVTPVIETSTGNEALISPPESSFNTTHATAYTNEAGIPVVLSNVSEMSSSNISISITYASLGGEGNINNKTTTLTSMSLKNGSFPTVKSDSLTTDHKHESSNTTGVMSTDASQNKTQTVTSINMETNQNKTLSNSSTGTSPGILKGTANISTASSMPTVTAVTTGRPKNTHTSFSGPTIGANQQISTSGSKVSTNRPTVSTELSTNASIAFTVTESVTPGAETNTGTELLTSSSKSSFNATHETSSTTEAGIMVFLNASGMPSSNTSINTAYASSSAAGNIINKPTVTTSNSMLQNTEPLSTITSTSSIVNCRNESSKSTAVMAPAASQNTTQTVMNISKENIPNSALSNSSGDSTHGILEGANGSITASNKWPITSFSTGSQTYNDTSLLAPQTPLSSPRSEVSTNKVSTVLSSSSSTSSTVTESMTLDRGESTGTEALTSPPSSFNTTHATDHMSKVGYPTVIANGNERSTSNTTISLNNAFSNTIGNITNKTTITNSTSKAENYVAFPTFTSDSLTHNYINESTKTTGVMTANVSKTSQTDTNTEIIQKTSTVDITLSSPTLSVVSLITDGKTNTPVSFSGSTSKAYVSLSTAESEGTSNGVSTELSNSSHISHIVTKPVTPGTETSTGTEPLTSSPSNTTQPTGFTNKPGTPMVFLNASGMFSSNTSINRTYASSSAGNNINNSFVTTSMSQNTEPLSTITSNFSTVNHSNESSKPTAVMSADDSQNTTQTVSIENTQNSALSNSSGDSTHEILKDTSGSTTASHKWPITSLSTGSQKHTQTPLLGPETSDNVTFSTTRSNGSTNGMSTELSASNHTSHTVTELMTPGTKTSTETEQLDSSPSKSSFNTTSATGFTKEAGNPMVFTNSSGMSYSNTSIGTTYASSSGVANIINNTGVMSTDVNQTTSQAGMNTNTKKTAQSNSSGGSTHGILEGTSDNVTVSPKWSITALTTGSQTNTHTSFLNPTTAYIPSPIPGSEVSTIGISTELIGSNDNSLTPDTKTSKGAVTPTSSPLSSFNTTHENGYTNEAGTSMVFVNTSGISSSNTRNNITYGSLNGVGNINKTTTGSISMSANVPFSTVTSDSSTQNHRNESSKTTDAMSADTRQTTSQTGMKTNMLLNSSEVSTHQISKSNTDTTSSTSKLSVSSLMTESHIQTQMLFSEPTHATSLPFSTSGSEMSANGVSTELSASSPTSFTLTKHTTPDSDTSTRTVPLTSSESSFTSSDESGHTNTAITLFTNAKGITPSINTNFASNGAGKTLNSEVTTVTSPFMLPSKPNSSSSDSSTMPPGITGSQTKSLMSLLESTITTHPQISTSESMGSVDGMSTKLSASSHTSHTATEPVTPDSAGTLTSLQSETLFTNTNESGHANKFITVFTNASGISSSNTSITTAYASSSNVSNITNNTIVTTSTSTSKNNVSFSTITSNSPTVDHRHESSKTTDAMSVDTSQMTNQTGLNTNMENTQNTISNSTGGSTPGILHHATDPSTRSSMSSMTSLTTGSETNTHTSFLTPRSVGSAHGMSTELSSSSYTSNTDSSSSAYTDSNDNISAAALSSKASQPISVSPDSRTQLSGSPTYSGGGGNILNSEVTTVTSPLVLTSKPNSLSSDSSTMSPGITGSQTKSLISESTTTAYPQISTPESKGSANEMSTQLSASSHISHTVTELVTPYTKRSTGTGPLTSSPSEFPLNTTHTNAGTSVVFANATGISSSNTSISMTYASSRGSGNITNKTIITTSTSMVENTASFLTFTHESSTHNDINESLNTTGVMSAQAGMNTNTEIIPKTFSNSSEGFHRETLEGTDNITSSTPTLPVVSLTKNSKNISTPSSEVSIISTNKASTEVSSSDHTSFTVTKPIPLDTEASTGIVPLTSLPSSFNTSTVLSSSSSTSSTVTESMTPDRGESTGTEVLTSPPSSFNTTHSTDHMSKVSYPTVIANENGSSLSNTTIGTNTASSSGSSHISHTVTELVTPDTKRSTGTGPLTSSPSELPLNTTHTNAGTSVVFANATGISSSNTSISMTYDPSGAENSMNKSTTSAFTTENSMSFSTANQRGEFSNTSPVTSVDPSKNTSHMGMNTNTETTHSNSSVGATHEIIVSTTGTNLLPFNSSTSYRYNQTTTKAPYVETALSSNPSATVSSESITVLNNSNRNTDISLSGITITKPQPPITQSEFSGNNISTELAVNNHSFTGTKPATEDSGTRTGTIPLTLPQSESSISSYAPGPAHEATFESKSSKSSLNASISTNFAPSSGAGNLIKNITAMTTIPTSENIASFSTVTSESSSMRPRYESSHTTHETLENKTNNNSSSADLSVSSLTTISPYFSNVTRTAESVQTSLASGQSVTQIPTAQTPKVTNFTAHTTMTSLQTDLTSSVYNGVNISVSFKSSTDKPQLTTPLDLYSNTSHHDISVSPSSTPVLFYNSSSKPISEMPLPSQSSSVIETTKVTIYSIPKTTTGPQTSTLSPTASSFISAQEPATTRTKDAVVSPTVVSLNDTLGASAQTANTAATKMYQTSDMIVTPQEISSTFNEIGTESMTSPVNEETASFTISANRTFLTVASTMSESTIKPLTQNKESNSTSSLENTVTSTSFGSNTKAPTSTLPPVTLTSDMPTAETNKPSMTDLLTTKFLSSFMESSTNQTTFLFTSLQSSNENNATRSPNLNQATVQSQQSTSIPEYVSEITTKPSINSTHVSYKISESTSEEHKKSAVGTGYTSSVNTSFSTSSTIISSSLPLSSLQASSNPTAPSIPSMQSSTLMNSKNYSGYTVDNLSVKSPTSSSEDIKSQKLDTTVTSDPEKKLTTVQMSPPMSDISFQTSRVTLANTVDGASVQTTITKATTSSTELTMSTPSEILASSTVSPTLQVASEAVMTNESTTSVVSRGQTVSSSLMNNITVDATLGKPVTSDNYSASQNAYQTIIPLTTSPSVSKQMTTDQFRSDKTLSNTPAMNATTERSTDQGTMSNNNQSSATTPITFHTQRITNHIVPSVTTESNSTYGSPTNMTLNSNDALSTLPNPSQTSTGVKIQPLPDSVIKGQIIFFTDNAKVPLFKRITFDYPIVQSGTFMTTNN